MQKSRKLHAIFDNYSVGTQVAYTGQLYPRYEGQLIWKAEPSTFPGRLSLIRPHDYHHSGNCGPTGRDGHGWVIERGRRCAPILHCLRPRECSMPWVAYERALSEVSSLDELPPVRLVIHRQTSRHARRKRTMVRAVEVRHWRVSAPCIHQL